MLETGLRSKVPWKRMPNKYSLEGDLVNRLGNCIFMYRGEPVLLKVCCSDTFILYDISGRNTKATIRTDDPDLDINSIEVGYMNRMVEDCKVIYLQREPYRKYRQGLSTDCLTYWDIESNPVSMHCPFKGEYLIYTKDFEDSLLGKFPTLDEFFSSSWKECAISQKIALKKTPVDIILVYLRGHNVGYIQKTDKKVVVPDRATAWIIKEELSSENLEVIVR